MLRDLLDEMVSILEAAVSTEEFPVQVVRGRWFNPTGPVLDIYGGAPFGDVVGAGFGALEGRVFLTVRARVQTADTTESQDILFDLMDVEHDLSVAAALMDDQTLGGYATSVLVGAPSDFRLYDELGQGALLGVEWPVTVLRAYS